MSKVNFKLSEDGRAAAFVAGGKMPVEDQVVEVDLEQATPEQRQVLLRGYKRELVDEPYRGLALYDLAGSDVSSIQQTPSWRKLDAIPTPEQALAMLVEQAPGLMEWRAESERKAAERKAKHEAWEAERDALKERIRLENEREREREAAKKARIEADKAAWVEAHGSDQLRRACARGHDCQRLYVVERAAVEAPGYVVDFQDSAQWKDRSCPSVKSLDEAEAAEALGLESTEVKIVWLTHPAAWRTDEVDPYEFDPREAVVIRGYMGKYDLVKVMGRQD